MKFLEKLVMIIALLSISSSAFSQFSANAHLGYRINFSDYKNNLNFGAMGEYIIASEKNQVYLGFDYYFPASSDGYVNGYDIMNGTSTTLPAKIKASYFSISFGAKRYLAGDAEDEFGFYIRGGLGLNYGSSTAVPDSYDENLYAVYPDDLEKVKLSSLTLNIGLGYEKEFDFGYVFAEGNVNLNTTSANASVDLGEESYWSLPGAFIVQAGVRIPIDF